MNHCVTRPSNGAVVVWLEPIGSDDAFISSVRASSTTLVPEFDGELRSRHGGARRRDGARQDRHVPRCRCRRPPPSQGFGHVEDHQNDHLHKRSDDRECQLGICHAGSQSPHEWRITNNTRALNDPEHPPAECQPWTATSTPAVRLKLAAASTTTTTGETDRFLSSIEWAFGEPGR